MEDARNDTEAPEYDEITFEGSQPDRTDAIYEKIRRDVVQTEHPVDVMPVLVNRQATTKKKCIGWKRFAIGTTVMLVILISVAGYLGWKTIADGLLDTLANDTTSPAMPTTFTTTDPTSTTAVTSSPVTSSTSVIAKDCFDLKSVGFNQGAVYNVSVATHTSYQRQIEVYCDTETDGGGWTVLLKRQDGSVQFEDLSWNEYKTGFGNIDGEYYIGNDNMHLLTMKNTRSYEIRIDLTSDSGLQQYAVYSSFMVDDETNRYTLHLGQHSGTLSDKFSLNDQQPFSTYDQDNDSLNSTNCAEIHHGGWWFWGCSFCKLTAGYGADGTLFDKMYWFGFNCTYISYADMKIRPI